MLRALIKNICNILLFINIFPSILSSQREYVVEVLSSSRSWTWSNDACASRYGTELATIISDQDRTTVISLTQSGQYWWIGMTDQATEGNWYWLDGTDCTITTGGDCSQFWSNPPNNIGDGLGESNADCSYWDSVVGGGTVNEAHCTNNGIFDGGYLCNANACNMAIIGASECITTSNCDINQQCNDRTGDGTLIILSGNAQCGQYCTCYCLDIPTTQPTTSPITTSIPSANPSISPSNNPSSTPSSNPSSNPTSNPTNIPSVYPTVNPSFLPTFDPTINPVRITFNPTVTPTKNPTFRRTSVTNPTNIPSSAPTKHVSGGIVIEETVSTEINAGTAITDNKSFIQDNFYLLFGVIAGVAMLCGCMLIAVILFYKFQINKAKPQNQLSALTASSPSISLHIKEFDDHDNHNGNAATLKMQQTIGNGEIELMETNNNHSGSVLKIWLTGIGISQYYDLFVQQNMTQSQIQSLDENELQQIGVENLEHRKLILGQISISNENEHIHTLEGDDTDVSTDDDDLYVEPDQYKTAGHKMTDVGNTMQ